MSESDVTQTLRKFRVNSATTVELKKASILSDGVMSRDDKIVLDALAEANFQGGDISTVTITGPGVEEIRHEFDNINSRIDHNETKIDKIITDVNDIDSTVKQHTETLKEVSRLTSTMYSTGYCGRVWDEGAATPTAKTYCGNLDMLRQLPELLGLGCYLVQNDHTRKKLDPENHYKFKNEEDYVDSNPEAKLDGSMGHYQWGWNKPFYITTWTENGMFHECISFEPIRGRKSYYIPVGSMSAAGHAAMDRETNTLVSYINDDVRYRGGDNKEQWDAEMENGKVPLVGRNLRGRCVTKLSITHLAEAARKNGEGWYAGTMRMWTVVKVLFEVIMGTRDVREPFIGQKDVNGLYQGGLKTSIISINSRKYNNDNPFLHMSVGVEKGDSLALTNELNLSYLDENDVVVDNRFRVAVFFGLKNIYGYKWMVTEDEFGFPDENENMVHYVRKSMYSDDYTPGMKNDAVYTLAKILPVHNYIKHMSYDRLESWPDTPGGSSNTYFCSMYHNFLPHNMTARAIFRGGGSGDGTRVGLSCIDAGYGIDFAYPYLGTALCEFTEDFLLEPIITPGN